MKSSETIILWKRIEALEASVANLTAKLEAPRIDLNQARDLQNKIATLIIRATDVVGPRGHMGPQGIAGDPGVQGEQGPIGLPGEYHGTLDDICNSGNETTYDIHTSGSLIVDETVKANKLELNLNVSDDDIVIQFQFPPT